MILELTIAVAVVMALILISAVVTSNLAYGASDDTTSHKSSGSSDKSSSNTHTDKSGKNSHDIVGNKGSHESPDSDTDPNPGPDHTKPTHCAGGNCNFDERTGKLKDDGRHSNHFPFFHFRDHDNHDDHNHSTKTVVVHDNDNVERTIIVNSNLQTGTCFVTQSQAANIDNLVAQLLDQCVSVTIIQG